MPRFCDVLDAADELSVEEQETLLEILRRRIANRNRAQIVRDVEEARREYSAGQCRAATAGEIMSEAAGESPTRPQ